MQHQPCCTPLRVRALPQVAIACLILTLAGCGRFTTLKTEVTRLEGDLYLRGDVTGVVAPAAPVNVLVFLNPKPKEFTILDGAILQPGDDSFAFSLPPGGPYYVVAYEDSDHNGRYDAGEPGWVYGKPDAIDFQGQRRSARLTVALDPNLKPSSELVEGLRAARSGRSIAELAQGHRMPISLGQIADLDASRFNPEVGELGLWQPATFLNEHGIGIYFAKPYDPNLIPVLLVHGASGTPRVWEDFAPRLDPKRFQVWYYSYPSGARLERAAEALEVAVADLHARYKFPRLDVVAHSMGGLVSRSFLLQAKQAGHADWLRHFVTISTPWGGHEAAALGVEYAPTSIPSWIDMQTNSDFTKKIYAENLPANVTYDLAFSFRGSGSVVLP
ncbi:MAG TPA: alpha/beta fold hydrolase, partial [Candidatus Didemnitutus sp.]|nr:alpha/beta fold hydrolase [Candidatus Didemnitutus sp.]